MCLPVIPIARRRSNHELHSQPGSPSGSPTNSSHFEMLELPGTTDDGLLLPRIQPLHRQSSYREVEGDLCTVGSSSPILVQDEDQCSFSDPKSSPQDATRSRNYPTYLTDETLGISVDPRRADTETAIPFAGTTIFSDEPTDSPESGVAWFSDSSSADGKETDSNDQDSPRYRSGVNCSTVLSEDDGFPVDDDDSVAENVVKRVASSRKIQRSWRQWKVKQESMRSLSAASDGAPLGEDERLEASERSQSAFPFDENLLTAGVHVVKVSKTQLHFLFDTTCAHFGSNVRALFVSSEKECKGRLERLQAFSVGG